MRRMRHLKPREIQGCQLALDASIPTSLYDATSGGSLVATDGAVARWEDQSGNGHHPTQGIAANRPTRRVASVGGLDCLEFDGSSDNMLGGTVFLNSQSACEFFVVYKSDGSASSAKSVARMREGTFGLLGFLERSTTVDYLTFSARTLIGDSATNAESSKVTGTATNAAHMSVDFSGGTFVGIENNAQTASGALVTSGSTAATNKRVEIAMANLSAFFDGRIGEIGLYHGAVSSAVRARLMCSRMRKWRING